MLAVVQDLHIPKVAVIKTKIVNMVLFLLLVLFILSFLFLLLRDFQPRQGLQIWRFDLILLKRLLFSVAAS